MSKLIATKKKTASVSATDKSGSQADPNNDCCTAPPDTDPGPIKP